MNITEDKLKAAIQIALGTLDLYTKETENLLIHHIKALTIPVVGCSLPSKERVTSQANSYAENYHKTEIDIRKKQAFEAGVNWLILCYHNEVR